MPRAAMFARLVACIVVCALVTAVITGCTTSQLPESRAGASVIKVAASSPTLGVGY
jgi:aconitase A